VKEEPKDVKKVKEDIFFAESEAACARDKYLAKQRVRKSKNRVKVNERAFLF
jgi:hypothetical protein